MTKNAVLTSTFPVACGCEKLFVHQFLVPERVGRNDQLVCAVSTLGFGEEQREEHWEVTLHLSQTFRLILGAVRQNIEGKESFQRTENIRLPVCLLTV